MNITRTPRQQAAEHTDAQHLLFSLLLLFHSHVVFALEPRTGHPSAHAPYRIETPLVRVGLMRFAAAETLVLSADPGAVLVGPDGQERAAGMGPWTFAATEQGARVVDANGKDLGVAAPGIVGAAYGFSLLAERPFLRSRTPVGHAEKARASHVPGAF